MKQLYLIFTILARHEYVRFCFQLIFTVITVIGTTLLAFGESSDPIDFFERKIRPILTENCHACHNQELKTAGLDLETAAGLKMGGQSGPLVSINNPEDSLLLKVIGYKEDLKMPPSGKLDVQDLNSLKMWVHMGTPWPKSIESLVSKKNESLKDPNEDNDVLWAFQPISDPAPPQVMDQSWIKTSIDRFVLARLEEKGLRPSASARKETLLRRATFNITGLPPTIDQIKQFVEDDSPEAFKKVIENLLASPRYGEHWARHWLDVARYADSTGSDEDHRYPYAWRYRDYVIEAFNKDLPFDRFVVEQIAGDLLPKSTELKVNQQRIIATGFLALGPKAIAQQDKTKMLYDVYDEQLDVISKGFLGLSITCARCHDHKFDPILTKDYYSLISILASTRNFKDSASHVASLLMKPLVSSKEYQEYQAHQDKIAAKKTILQELVGKVNERLIEVESTKLVNYFIAAYQVYTQGKNSKVLAKQYGLHEALLKKWSSYLAPNQTFRPHLLNWQRARPTDLFFVARDYQEKFRLQFTEWTSRLNQWRQKIKQISKKEDREPAPKFLPGKDRFFYEVYLNSKPKNEKITAPFLISDSDHELFSPKTVNIIKRLKREIEFLQKISPKEPQMANAVEEGIIVDQQIFRRGNPNILGEPVRKKFPVVFDDKCKDFVIEKGSGRLQLAKWLTQPYHPLTARVIVNRVWQWHFGEGLVRTPDNFGTTGNRPSHPKLLDHLARKFTDGGWSIKNLHRLIMQSNIYQQASFRSKSMISIDPNNELWSHFPRRRLDAEEIRDGMLAVDDTLDPKMGIILQEGTGFQPENSADRLSLDPESFLFRTVYLPLRRANLPPFLRLFDFGDATNSSGKRLQTNVPPQALFMMNSKFVEERSRNLAKMLFKSSLSSNREKVQYTYLRILNRLPSVKEEDTALSYIEKFQQKTNKTEDGLNSWQSYCHILFSSNEFIYVD